MAEDAMKTPVNINPWEEEMIAEFAKKYAISEDAVMDIGITFLLNEMESARHHNPCFMTALSTALIQRDMEAAKTKEDNNDNAGV